jgi:superfamily II DNA/RNA helicase
VSKARDKAGSGADISGISTEIKKLRGSDWAETSVYYLERYLGEKRTLAYFDTKKEAEAFVKEASEKGIDVDFVHSGRKKSDNEAAIERFNQKGLRVLASVDMISEGYDVDAEAVLIDKTTTSKKEYRQIIGRCARSYGEDKINKSVVLDLGASTYLYGEMEAQAAMNNIRGKLDTKVMGQNDILPEQSIGKNNIWVEVSSEKSKAYATAIDGQLIYVVPMEDNYAAFASYKDRKGQHFEMLSIEGQRKGMPTRDAFGKWAEDAVRRNERHLARLSSSNSTDRLEQMVSQDWIRSSSSIDKSLAIITQYAPAMAAQQSQAFQRA